MFSVVPLTLTISLCLVFTFVVFFLREHSRRRFGSSESDALLPLSEETPRAAAAASGAARPPRTSRGEGRESARRVVVLDLGGRLPKRRRRPCGRHGDGGGDCDDCEHKHEHHDHHHAGGECARRQERRETDAA
jgi:hypothetical protein